MRPRESDAPEYQSTLTPTFVAWEIVAPVPRLAAAVPGSQRDPTRSSRWNCVWLASLRHLGSAPKASVRSPITRFSHAFTCGPQPQLVADVLSTTFPVKSFHNFASGPVSRHPCRRPSRRKTVHGPSVLHERTYPRTRRSHAERSDDGRLSTDADGSRRARGATELG